MRISAEQARKDLGDSLTSMIEFLKPNNMFVTSCQVFLLAETEGTRTKALARVILNDCLQLTGLRVIDGASGLFVAYPNNPDYKGAQYRSIFYPVTRELRDLITKNVLDKYKEALDDAEDISIKRKPVRNSRARGKRKA